MTGLQMRTIVHLMVPILETERVACWSNLAGGVLIAHVTVGESRNLGAWA
jgi:hypothetical protein